MRNTKNFFLLATFAAALIMGGCATARSQPEQASPSAEQLIETLELEAHVEGGFFQRTYQADHRDMIETEGGERFLLTSIFYLLTNSSSIGHLHLNKSDILHYFQLGDPIRYTLIHPDGSLEQVTLGHDVEAGQQLQLHVPGGVWKASQLMEGEHGYGLISEAVSPGFDFDDMTLADTTTLADRFPQHSTLIEMLSRDRED